MTALAGVELESLVSEPDALTTRPPKEVFQILLGQLNLRWPDIRAMNIP